MSRRWSSVLIGTVIDASPEALERRRGEADRCGGEDAPVLPNTRSPRARSAAVAAAVIAGALAAAAPAAAVSAFPSPGVGVASPSTQISFRDIAPGALTGVQVVGSRSGRHGGTLRAHSDGNGASFLPARPFQAGERVTVTGPFRIAGADPGPYSFRVARFAPNVPLRTKPGRTPAAGTMRLRTRPDLRPPAWDVHRSRPGTDGGEIFAGPKLFATRGGQEGAQILAPDGRVRYWRPMPSGMKATDVRAQPYRGGVAMTFWQGATAGGQGRGEGVILGSRYQVLQRVRMGNGYAMDLHEFRLTPQGTALVMAYQAIRYGLRSVGGPRDGTIIDGVIQEIDLATGLVLFEWHSAGSVALRESDTRRRGRAPWDYFHPNSLWADGTDGIVVSARHTSAVYRIARTTGRIDWRLGGTRSDFRLGPGASFARQHDAQVQPDGLVRIFDNSNRRGRRRSRVITLRLDRANRRATLVRALSRDGSQFAGTQGNAEVLAGGTTFANWGSRGGVSEIAASGSVLFDAWLPPGWDNYRAYRAAWSGVPSTRPKVVARASGERTVVSASWNGATEVTGWRVLAGDSRDALAPVGDAPWRDLETAMRVPSGARWFAVQALGAGGEVLAISHATRRRG
jgi:hypothetical protein